MKKFPKKYNYKNTNIQDSKTNKFSKSKKKSNKWKDIYSTLFPADQKIHPWCIFSLFFQDLMSEIYSLQWKTTKRDAWFWVSSDFYSKLNKPDINITHIEDKVLKQAKQNKRFFDKLWLWCDISAEDFVLSEQFNRYIRTVFVDLYKDQKITSQKQIAYRSRNFQTNLFKNNIRVEKQQVTEYTIKYFVDSKWHALTIPTTSLETIFADVAVAVNPQDKRYKKLIGQSVIIPIINKIIPIIWDEDVDSFKWSGVFRVTPGHDKYGLELAQKHDLPTNIFAIDTDWNFTKHAGEFSWKPVDEFLENIIKYIDDIWNLELKRKLNEDKKFDRHTWEQLDNMLLDQRSIGYSYALDYLSEKLPLEDFSVVPKEQKQDILDILENKNRVNISNKSKKWILVPIVQASKWDIFPINDDIVVDRHKASKTKRTVTLTLIIINLILDNHLSVSFTIEELIDALFMSNFSGETTKLEKYLQIYEQEAIEKKEYKKWLKDIQKLLWKIDKDSEKIQLMVDLLKNSFAIKMDDENILVDFASLFAKRDELVLQTEDGFSKSFVDSVRFLYKNNLLYDQSSYDSVKNMWWTMFACNDQKDFVLNTILLSLEYSRKMIFSGSVFHSTLVDTKWNKIVNSNSRFLIKDFGENLNMYWPDAMRLTLLLSQKNDDNIKFDTYKAQDYHQALNKIRNASRYVYGKYISDKKDINLKSLIKKIKSNITDYDLWMIHSIKIMLDDYEYQIQENNTLELWSKILAFCQNTLCDKYLEASKINSDKNTDSAMILSFALVLKLIKPYVPYFVWEIEDMFNIDREDYNILDFREFTPKEKNYKINLLMDIVDKLQNLKLKIWSKKHEGVDIFIQANPEFLDFLMSSQDLLKSLINISDIECIRLHEDIPQWYETDNVININLWVRAVEQEEVKKDVLVEMKEDRNNKMEHLQHLKSLIASVSQVGNEEIIKQKRKDIVKLQEEVEELDFDITKLKAKQ